MTNDQKRLGFVGIIVDDREKCSEVVNKILSEHSDLILARTGLPNAKGKSSIITLVIDATTDELGLLTGKLGSIEGISVKSGLARQKTIPSVTSNNPSSSDSKKNPTIKPEL